MRLTRIIAAWLASLSWSACSSSAEPSAEFMLTGFRDSRERLRSGEYQCDGTLADEVPGHASTKVPFSIHVWFDHDAESIRYDFTNPRRKSFRKRGPPQGNTESSKYVRKPDQTIFWTADSIAVIIGSPSEKIPLGIRPFDVRLAGICTYYNYTKGDVFNTAIAQQLKNVTDPKVFVTRPDVATLRVTSPGRFGNLHTDFDEAKGYLPFKLELVRPPQRTREQLPVGPGKVVESAKVKWVSVNDNWVPETITAASQGGPPIHRIDMTFEWVSVNEPIDPELFTTRGMDLPEGTLIGDSRAGGTRPVMLGQVGDMRPGPRLARIEPPMARPWWRGWRGIALAVALTLPIGFGVRAWSRSGRNQEVRS